LISIEAHHEAGLGLLGVGFQYAGFAGDEGHLQVGRGQGRVCGKRCQDCRCDDFFMVHAVSLNIRLIDLR
jgi:hypothetical protein